MSDGAGKITVKATLTGNDNYNDCTIQHILNVTEKKGRKRRTSHEWTLSRR